MHDKDGEPDTEASGTMGKETAHGDGVVDADAFVNLSLRDDLEDMA